LTRTDDNNNNNLKIKIITIKPISIIIIIIIIITVLLSFITSKEAAYEHIQKENNTEKTKSKTYI